ncbi:L,D-transpeptidase [Fulvimarina pelagi]|uniref:L,D-transpeptidase n=1 Tax=Fulvimarina pelagi TaxID=217511 RepID=UPI00030A83C7|nr:L,D-transpeptidase [Fulvimarina pelagi]
MPFTRRTALTGLGLLALGGCTSANRIAASAPPRSRPRLQNATSGSWTYPTYYGPIYSEPFTIPAVPPGVVAPQYWRQLVDDPTGEQPGTLVVDPDEKYLYLVQEGGQALRYGIGVGRQGFSWSGSARVQYKKQWPTWTPPREMIERQPELEPYSAANGGMPPGLSNPLGARALYLFQDGVDTLYRIHGSPEANSIGRAVSSGCIRLLNHEIIDLYSRVPDGTLVKVRPSRRQIETSSVMAAL